jgi:hypothetical protein
VSETLDRYLTQAYRREVLGESVVIEMPPPEDDLIAEIEAQIARVDSLRLGASLASRDFASYANRRALFGLLSALRLERERRRNADERS